MRRETLDALENALLLVLVLISLWATVGFWRAQPDLYFVPQHRVFLPEVSGPGLTAEPPFLVWRNGAGGRLYLAGTGPYRALWRSVEARMRAVHDLRPGAITFPASVVAYATPAGLMEPLEATAVPPSAVAGGATVVLPVAQGRLAMLVAGDGRAFHFATSPLPLPPVAGVAVAAVGTAPLSVVPLLPIPLPRLRLTATQPRALAERSFQNPLAVREVPAGTADVALSDGTSVLRLYAGGLLVYTRSLGASGTAPPSAPSAAVLAADAFATEHPLFGAETVTAVASAGRARLVVVDPTFRGVPVLSQLRYRVMGGTVIEAAGRSFTASAGRASAVPDLRDVSRRLAPSALASLRLGEPVYAVRGDEALPALLLVFRDGRTEVVAAGGDLAVGRGR